MSGAPNKGKPWDDDELRLILLDPPTRDSCIKHAEDFGRGIGSIELVYRFAMTPSRVAEQLDRGRSAFARRVKALARELGWVA